MADKIDNYHEKAMEMAELAFIAKIQGRISEASRLLNKALDFESTAASLTSSSLDLEPTRSVLHRSAASIALECGKYRIAERLIANALAGDPPDDIAEELRDLLEQVNFLRHLQLKGIILSDDELQLSISGKDVGYGFAEGEEFIRRIDFMEKLVFRTAERIAEKPYRMAGRTDKKVLKNIGFYISIPRAASFVVTIRLSKQQHEMEFPGVGQPEKVIDNIIQTLTLYNENKERQLKNLIADDNYYDNFIVLANKIAPDGEKVNQVGITIIRDGKEQSIALQKRPKFVTAIRDKIISVEPPTVTSITGYLKFADSTTDKNKIKLIDENEKSHTVIVPESMMDDIVKPLWGDMVTVYGELIGNTLRLKDIEKS
ncbi:MAG: hypothetical protein ACXADW_23640 [Candidatus Hodarchaeales archaeon]|jgi:tetratricopeptide (TPR) repeat protein